MPCLVGSELPVYSRLPVVAARGEGCTIWDREGRAYLDLYGGHAVAALGYGHAGWTQTVASHLESLQFQTNALHLDVRDEAIQALAAVAPPGLNNVFLVNSGAEANENALRMAFWHTGRSKVVCLEGGFHGRTAASGAVTDGSEKWFGFPRAPFDVERVSPGDVRSLDAALTPDTAAFLFEPVQGVAGGLDLDPEFVQTAASLCRERGILMVADEVQTGIGRTGTMFCMEQYGVTPDLLTTAKGLGNGFPVAAVLCNSALAAHAKPGMLGTTFGGGPMACAAILAVLHEVNAPGFLEGVQSRAAFLRETCLRAGVPRVTGRGFLIGLHLGIPAAPVRQALLAKGFLTGDARDPNVVRLLPPLILSHTEIEPFGAALGEVLA